MKNWLKEHVDVPVLAVVLMLVGISVGSIYSATYDTGSLTYFHRQIVFACVGFLRMISVAVMPFRTLQMLSYPLYGISVIVLAMILIAGKVVAGSKSWFGVGGFGLQPSELGKVTTILALAAYLSRGNANLHR